MTNKYFLILTMSMILGAFFVIPSADALVVTPDGFTQSSGHSRYTSSSNGGRVCGLELCNLGVPKSIADVDSISFVKPEGKELSKEQIIEKTLGGEFAKAILANYNEHKGRDVGMLTIDETNSGNLLFANPDFVDPKPTKETLQRTSEDILNFNVILPEYIAKYPLGYANEDFPTYKPKTSLLDNVSIGMPAILGSDVQEMIVCTPSNANYTSIGCDTDNTSVSLIDTINIQDTPIVNATSTNSTSGIP